MGAQAIQIAPTALTSDDDIRAMTREWLIDMFAEHMNMDANSRHILETFLQLAGNRDCVPRSSMTERW